MTTTVANLVLDHLEWLGPDGRSDAETMDAWRTSCPRLSVWEEATDDDYVSVLGAFVGVTVAGSEFLRLRRGSARSA
jgi:hypothetical protein